MSRSWASLRRPAAGFFVLAVSLLALSGLLNKREEEPDELWYNVKQLRVPRRSVDSFGGYLPSVANEVRVPGFFATDNDGLGAVAKPLKLIGQASLQPQAVTVQAPAPAQAPVANVQGPGVPIHVVDTPEGKVIYYPYIPVGGSGGLKGSSVGLNAVQGGTALATGGVGGVTGKAIQEQDGSWSAPYGDFRAIQGGDVKQKEQQQAAYIERQFDDYKADARKRLERVKGKVWRDHKRFVEMRREMDRLNEEVKEIRFKWRNGPWPNTGARGPPGFQGVAGPSGTNGAPGLPGKPGRMGATVVVKDVIKPTEKQVQEMVSGEVLKDVKQDMALEMAHKLADQSKKMEVMRKANDSLIKKMKEQSKKFKAEEAKLAAKVKHRTEAEKLKSYINRLEGSTPPLPKGWTEREDPYGRVYYDNVITHVTQWNRPMPPGVHPEDVNAPVTPRKFVLTSGGDSEEGQDKENK